MKKYIGVDVGGTNYRIGLVDEHGVLERVVKKSSKAEGGVSPEILAASIREMMEKEEIGGVGVGVPGVVLEAGRITLTTNLQQLEGFSLRDYLQGALQTPVLVENDGNVAGLAEAVAGRGKGYESTYYITVSTGIGGAFVQNGRIFRGKSGFAGEIGSMIVHLSGESYRGLYPGMIEGIASGDALKSRGELALLRPLADAGEMFRLAKEDETARRLVDQMAYALGVLCSNLTYVLNPGVFVFGGGCMKSGEMFWEKMQAHYQSMVPYPDARADFRMAALEEPGVLGAGLMILREIQGI